MNQFEAKFTVFLYVHSLTSYEDLRATINPHSNRRSCIVSSIVGIL